MALAEGRDHHYNLVSERDVHAFASTPEGRHLARLEADQRLMLRLSREGFQGTAWEGVASALVEYGLAVMVAWILTGTVFVKLHERGIGGASLRRPREGIPQEQAHELAQETVGDAIIQFRDRVLRTGRWDPSKGASLATFFIGNCLLRFPNVYRRWCQGWDAHRRQAPLEVAEGLPATSDPEAEALGSIAVDERVAALDPRLRALVLLMMIGYTVKEAAHLSGSSVRSAESRLYRARRRHREEEAG